MTRQAPPTKHHHNKKKITNTKPTHIIHNKQIKCKQATAIMQHLFPWPSTFQTLSHTTFGSWWWCCIINLGFHPSPLHFSSHYFQEPAVMRSPCWACFPPPSHLLSQPYILCQNRASQFLRTAGYQVPMLGFVFLLTLLTKPYARIGSSICGNLRLPCAHVGVCPPTRCHQCWLVAEFWPGYQAG